jgi:hypothetical protein
MPDRAIGPGGDRLREKLWHAARAFLYLRSLSAARSVPTFGGLSVRLRSWQIRRKWCILFRHQGFMADPQRRTLALWRKP